jgi:hypothetical protein
MNIFLGVWRRENSFPETKWMRTMATVSREVATALEQYRQ